jgi:hypothetical protein
VSNATVELDNRLKALEQITAEMSATKLLARLEKIEAATLSTRRINAFDHVMRAHYSHLLKVLNDWSQMS